MRFRDVQLELVRPGPPHNQLLSPLTQYLALCGETSPVTLRIEFEHRRLLSRLERLRYVTPNRKGRPVSVPAPMRERELSELGEDMGKFLADVVGLPNELANARVDDPDVDADTVHLRLVLNGSELALLPYELAIAPQSMPGEAIEVLLQSRVPIVATREVRRSRPLPTRLDGIGEVRVLYIHADPDGGGIPSDEHLAQLAAALEPWVDKPDPRETTPDGLDHARVEELKKRIRVLPNASVADIEDACRAERFSHVHVLAHGAPYRHAGEDQFGIALCDSRDPSRTDVVSGQRLAKALRAESEDGIGRNAPFWVTLATCDSGNAGSVLVPGGSIAHDLHTHGVPWVIASQFPLTKSGSVKMTRFMYPRLFRGDDPRQVLYELRRHLYSRATVDHDWASLVVYASTPPDFDQQVVTFMTTVTGQAIDRDMKYIDDLSGDGDGSADDAGSEAGGEDAGGEERIEEKAETVDRVMQRLEELERRVPSGLTLEGRAARTYLSGMTGSVKKRLALLTDEQGEKETLLREAMHAYREGTQELLATDGSRFGWVAGQYLSLRAVLDGELDRDVQAMCRKVVLRDLNDPAKRVRGWALGTLAEIELLGLIGDSGGEELANKDKSEIHRTVKEYCEELRELMGAGSFHVESTLRQFERYRNEYPDVAAKGVLAKLQYGVGVAIRELSAPG